MRVCEIPNPDDQSRFLESDTDTRLIAKPQLRGAEGPNDHVGIRDLGFGLWDLTQCQL